MPSLLLSKYKKKLIHYGLWMDKTEHQEKKTKGSNHLKTIVKTLNDLYSIHQTQCYFDSIVGLCKIYDLKDYANRINKKILYKEDIDD